jgi:hypothetical protein
MEICLPKNTKIGYKALPDIPGLPLSKLLTSTNTSLSDWTGFYPQFSVASAVNYLPNQWDRNVKKASISEIITTTDLTVIKIDNKVLSDNLVSSDEKARIVKGILNFDQETPLSMSLGEKRICLCLMDCDYYEYLIPLDLLDSLEHKTIFSISQDPNHPGITGNVEGHEWLSKRVVQDPVKLGKALSELVDDPECRKVRKILAI